MTDKASQIGVLKPPPHVLNLYQKLAAFFIVLPNLRSFFSNLEIAFTNGFNSSDFILSAVVTLLACALAFFVFHGKKWAITLSMTLLTLNQILLLLDKNYTGIGMWFVLMFFLGTVLQSKLKKSETTKASHS